MRMNKYFLDTNILMYAAGKEHIFKKPCIELLEKAVSGEIEVYTDAHVFQEILHRSISQQNLKVGIQIFDEYIKIMNGKILPITFRELKILRKFVEKYPHDKAGDLLHLSVMITNNIDKIITLDKDFKRFKEVITFNPADLL
ncbi:MAG: type II toxin-antitoxin system VapC family toxin [Actinobacteria bacterium]|nr:type II toxin-antitoxin system VapC family toxin [Actinomycetota bacterium]